MWSHYYILVKYTFDLTSRLQFVYDGERAGTVLPGSILCGIML